MFVPRYTEQQAREAIAGALCYTEALRKLGMRPAGGNHRVLREYAEEIWRIPTDHFDPQRARLAKLGHRPTPLELVLGAGLHLQPDQTQGAALRDRNEGAPMRGVWPGRGMARVAYVVDSRPHQWNRGRQSAREPQDRVSQLCCDARHALRAQEQALRARLRPMRSNLLATDSEAEVLLAILRYAPLKWPAGTKAGAPEGRAALL